MKILGAVFGGFIVIFLFIGLSIGGIYNGFVGKNQDVQTAWSQVETQYQRRFDLIPSLVEATKGIFEQERSVFKAIADARTHYAGTSASSPDRAQATGQLDSALGRLLIVMENYPQLKSSDTVRGLMDELAGTENRVNIARQRYNLVVNSYNSSVQTFPGNFFAQMWGFTVKDYFKSQTGSEIGPKVSLHIGGVA